jgi:hypothetical protein
MRSILWLLIACGLSFPAIAYAEGTDTSVLKFPQDIEFKGPLTGAPQTAIFGRHRRDKLAWVASAIVDGLRA